MKIVIAGAGEVGTHLAKLLSNENQEIVVIDKKVERLENLNTQNLLVKVKNPIAVSTHKEEDVLAPDLFIAVTPFETDNIIACSMAHHYGAKKTVARIDNYDYLRTENAEYFMGVGIDELIYPEYLAAEEMTEALHHTWTRNWFDLFNGELIVVGVKLRKEAPITGKKIKDIGSVISTMHISAIRRENEIIIPRGDDTVELNDIVYVATTKNHIADVVKACNKTKVNVKKVLIMGASRIAIQLVHMGCELYDFTIIEKDKDKAHRLSEKFDQLCDFQWGDGRDPDSIEGLDYSDFDAFVALTDSSETNILACLTAKSRGVAKTIAEVEDIQFIPEAESLNIGTIVNKKLLASSRIFQMLLDNDASNSKCLALTDAEVAELVVKEGSKVTKKDIRELSMPREMTLAGLVRNGVGQLVQGNTRLQAGDHVVVFCLSGALNKIEKYFG